MCSTSTAGSMPVTSHASTRLKFEIHRRVNACYLARERPFEVRDRAMSCFCTPEGPSFALCILRCGVGDVTSFFFIERAPRGPNKTLDLRSWRSLLWSTYRCTRSPPERTAVNSSGSRKRQAQWIHALSPVGDIALDMVILSPIIVVDGCCHVCFAARCFFDVCDMPPRVRRTLKSSTGAQPLLAGSP